MKKIIALFLFFVWSGFTLENEVVYVEFTNQTTFRDVVKIKEDMKNLGISLNYTKLEFDESERLSAIKFYIDCNDGFRGSGGSDKLTHNGISFMRDYRDGARIPFGINCKPSLK